ncbi:hypothetical protein AGABI1DRAFT_101427 [Agaricus bisporus var. burnettii JB137-S8]|uniref:DUF6729 domain-containing protein n=1 Tax=Agaricus bisporus var. burnettii (strain JB137-S8 / ATCC MYA-4627 / FGSC 10392) TaxID=597362 RepID=K5VUN3_AGABU|nr:uncharacterized protein AGABI1DRAFT_101427 [Agaricus bisporus var. burnettii JB137-S8]EKM78169.1 hypothetical protein AGABI1DRAFT_101427 [Agaricus bisporus var. burnettii JB137-S8]
MDDITTNDEETYADGEGIGAGEERPEGVEDDDFDEEVDEDQSLRRRPLPPWLWNSFNARVDESKPRNVQGLPPLYADKNTRHVTPSDLFNPQFFLWDPQALCKSIPCPQCKAPLQRHQHIPWPRRCVDLNSTFWIIGYRYRCSYCLNLRTQRRTVTYRSWDPQILAVLPSHIANEFSAYLSHQNAMSKSLFEWMRSCFQNGVGSKQFSDSLRVQHLLAYDKLHLQYLHYLVSLRQTLHAYLGRKYESFLPFDDVTPRGHHGFTPGSEWLRDMYDNFIEEHQHDFNQHMSMLTGEICAIDHSHKVTKHIARVNREQIFTVLLTVTNEKGEIRVCNFVATKSHSQYETALNRMRESLDKYGHNQPILFYTDNMADKQFLEKSFPSLRKDVIPVEKYSRLDPFIIPSNVQILIKDTVRDLQPTATIIF